MNFEKLPTRKKEGAFHVVVESPRNSQVKLKYSPVWEAFTISRPLALGLAYPFDWGFIPGTHAPDGDPLDAMILSDFASFPGTVISCRALGVIRLEQNRKNKKGRERNDRVIALPTVSPRLDLWRTPSDLSERFRKELEHFFIAAVYLQKKEPLILQWEGPSAAETLIRKSQRS